jgi:hypothetical protein
MSASYKKITSYLEKSKNSDRFGNFENALDLLVKGELVAFFAENGYTDISDDVRLGREKEIFLAMKMSDVRVMVGIYEDKLEFACVSQHDMKNGFAAYVTEDGISDIPRTLATLDAEIRKTIDTIPLENNADDKKGTDSKRISSSKLYRLLAVICILVPIVALSVITFFVTLKNSSFVLGPWFVIIVITLCVLFGVFNILSIVKRNER